MRYALVIGNSKYDDPKLAQLKTPEADTRELAKVLRTKSIGNFDEVASLLDQPEAKTRRAISAFLSNKKPDDLVLLYFSGHGVLDGRGNLFLASKDTEYDSLNATAIPSSFLSYEMDSCRSRKQILILDCCNSGAFARAAKGSQKAVTESTFEGNGSGRVVLTASDSTQFAFEGDRIIPQTEFSLFTHFLLEGLKTGRADRDNDGKVSLDEWYDYCHSKITATTPQQVPHKWSYRQQGDLVIAQNPFAKKKAQPKTLQLRAMLDQKQKDFQQHGLLLDSKELEIIANELNRTKLELQEDDKRLILLSAVVYDDGQKWLGICGVNGVEWLRRAYQDGKLPQKVRLGAVRLLGREADEKTLTNLMEMIERGSHSKEVDQELDLLAYYLDRSPHPPTIPWKLRRLLFPRLVQIIVGRTEPMRARINRGIMLLVPVCVTILFGASFLTDPESNFWFLLLSLLIFSSFGILLGLGFTWVITTLGLIRGILPTSLLVLAVLSAGSLLGVILFTALTGSTEVWIASVAGGALLAGAHLLSLWKTHRYWVYLSLPIAIVIAALVYGFSVSEDLPSRLGESLSAGLFAAGYVYLVTAVKEKRNAYN